MAVFVKKTEVMGVMNANIPVICKYFTKQGGGARWLSGRVLDLTEGPRVRVTPASLFLVLEQEH